MSDKLSPQDAVAVLKELESEYMVISDDLYKFSVRAALARDSVTEGTLGWAALAAFVHSANGALSCAALASSMIDASGGPHDDGTVTRIIDLFRTLGEEAARKPPQVKLSGADN